MAANGMDPSAEMVSNNDFSNNLHTLASLIQEFSSRISLNRNILSSLQENIEQPKEILSTEQDTDVVDELLKHNESLRAENASLRSDIVSLKKLLHEYEQGLVRSIEQFRLHSLETMERFVVMNKVHHGQLEQEYKLNDTMRQQTIEMQQSLHKISLPLRQFLES